MDLKDVVITIRLRPDQVNTILAKLGACPFNEVAELISIIKQQGEAALQAYQAQQGTQNGVDPAAVPAG